MKSSQGTKVKSSNYINKNDRWSWTSAVQISYKLLKLISYTKHVWV